MPHAIETSLADELIYVSTKLPAPVLRIVDRIARREMRTRSDFLRSIVIAHLRERGLVAVAREIEDA